MELLHGIAVLGLIILDEIIIILSMSLDYWSYQATDQVKYYLGLWKACTESKTTGVTFCFDIPNAHADYKSVRAMLFLAIFSVAGAFVCVIIKLLVKKDNKLLMYAAAACLGFAGICLMIGFAVYHAEIFNPEKILLPDASLHAGFALCIISWLLSFALAGAILFLVFREGD